MKPFFLLIFVFISILAFSQLEYDSKLLVKFDKVYLNQQLIDNPNFIKRQNFLVNNSYQIISVIDLKEGGHVEKLYKIDNFTKQKVEYIFTNDDFNNFNLFEYYYQTTKSGTYYKLGDTGKILQVFSTPVITQMYNELSR